MPTVSLDLNYLRDNNLNFDKNFSYCPDYKLFMTLSMNSKIFISEEIVAKYRIHENNLSKYARKIIGIENMKVINSLELSAKDKINKDLKDGFLFAKSKAKILISISLLAEGKRLKSIYSLISNRPLKLKSVLLIFIIIF